MTNRAFRAAVAAGLLAAAAAPLSAATTLSITSNPEPCNTTNCSFAIDGSTDEAAFSEAASFYLPAGRLTGMISNSPIDDVTRIDFSAITLTGPNGFSQHFAITPGGFSSGYLAPVGLAAGTYSLGVEGTSGGNASFGGNLSFVAVPDSATWMMLILGMGLVGAALRGRRRDEEAEAGPLMTETF